MRFEQTAKPDEQGSEGDWTLAAREFVDGVMAEIEAEQEAEGRSGEDEEPPSKS